MGLSIEAGGRLDLQLKPIARTTPRNTTIPPSTRIVTGRFIVLSAGGWVILLGFGLPGLSDRDSRWLLSRFVPLDRAVFLAIRDFDDGIIQPLLGQILVPPRAG